jgi:hypothetical protein
MNFASVVFVRYPHARFISVILGGAFRNRQHRYTILSVVELDRCAPAITTIAAPEQALFVLAGVPRSLGRLAPHDTGIWYAPGSGLWSATGRIRSLSCARLGLGNRFWIRTCYARATFVLFRPSPICSPGLPVLRPAPPSSGPDLPRVSEFERSLTLLTPRRLYASGCCGYCAWCFADTAHALFTYEHPSASLDGQPGDQRCGFRQLPGA